MLIICAGFLVSCATAAPTELVDARQAYQKASTGPAARLTPVELHKAAEALAQAEQSFLSDPHSYHTRDLAYVAERKANLAEARADIVSAQRSTARANNDFQATQGDIMKQTKQDLNRTRTDLAASERAGEMTADQLSVERQAGLDADKRSADAQATAAERLSVEQQARLDAEKRSTDAQATAAERLSVEQQARLDAEKRSTDAEAALVKLAAVKEEARGLVITLSGSVLFASNKSTLLPSARARLNQVAEALMATKERKLIVEGHTDSQGTSGYNLDLSQRRAEAVRAYLISRDYPANRIQAHGIGKVRPVADNASPEGRANNRRVEIIVEPEVKR
jgi:outer membrane protein OmpA-like peptidoglycan-associated protein